MKINVMSKAWEIAKGGAAMFGGKVKEYFAEALRMAWAIIKKGANAVAEYVTIETLPGSRNHKTWVAEITGLNGTYKFNREFIDVYDYDGANKFFRLFEGKVYDVCDGGYRTYVKVENGKAVEINEYAVKEMFN